MSRVDIPPRDVEYHYSIADYGTCATHLMVGEAWGHAAAEVRVVEAGESDTAVRAELELAVYDKLNGMADAHANRPGGPTGVSG